MQELGFSVDKTPMIGELTAIMYKINFPQEYVLVRVSYINQLKYYVCRKDKFPNAIDCFYLLSTTNYHNVLQKSRAFVRLSHYLDAIGQCLHFRV